MAANMSPLFLDLENDVLELHSDLEGLVFASSPEWKFAWQESGMNTHTQTHNTETSMRDKDKIG